MKNLLIRYFLDKYYLHLDSFTRYRYKILKNFLIYGKINTLNIGTGGGVETLFLLENKNIVTAVDIDNDVISRTKKRVLRNKYENKFSIYKQHINNFNSKSKFDLIYMCEVLEHIEDDKKTIKKVSDLLNLNASLIISTPTSSNGLFPFYKISKTEDGGHVRSGYDGDELDLLLSEYNIRTIKRIFIGSKSVFLLQYIEKLLRRVYIGYLFGFVLYFLIPIIDLFDKQYCNQITIAQKIK